MAACLWMHTLGSHLLQSQTADSQPGGLPLFVPGTWWQLRVLLFVCEIQGFDGVLMLTKLLQLVALRAGPNIYALIILFFNIVC